jgi:hypothetical protein
MAGTVPAIVWGLCPVGLTGKKGLSHGGRGVLHERGAAIARDIQVQLTEPALINCPASLTT